MRGKVFLAPLVLSVIRITPAYAGKRKRRLTTTAADGDHPRLCGEKTYVITNQEFNDGSPPPMRGKGSGWRWVITISQDHPRLCGEKGRNSDGKRRF